MLIIYFIFVPGHTGVRSAVIKWINGNSKWGRKERLSSHTKRYKFGPPVKGAYIWMWTVAGVKGILE
jgi:hypothetical protein